MVLQVGTDRHARSRGDRTHTILNFMEEVMAYTPSTARACLRQPARAGVVFACMSTIKIIRTLVTIPVYSRPGITWKLPSTTCASAILAYPTPEWSQRPRSDMFLI